MQTLHQHEINLVSGGNFTEMYATTLFGLAVGTALGSVCDNGVPLLSPIGEYLLPNVGCLATQTGLGGAIFGFTLGAGWLLANILDNAYNAKSDEIVVVG
jgi:hypothetical protein